MAEAVVERLQGGAHADWCRGHLNRRWQKQAYRNRSDTTRVKTVHTVRVNRLHLGLSLFTVWLTHRERLLGLFDQTTVYGLTE